MPNRTITYGGNEYIEVDIPYAAHSNLLAGIKPQGCWELDSSAANRMLRTYHIDHNHCLDTSGDATEVYASRTHFDRFGFPLFNPVSWS